MNGRGVSMEVKRALRNTVVVQPSHMQARHGPGMKVMRSRVQEEVSCLCSSCGVSRRDGIHIGVCIRIL